MSFFGEGGSVKASLILSAVLLYPALAAGAEERAPEPPVQTRALGGARWEDLYVLSAPGADLRLSRPGALWGSERVLRDGRPLRAGVDYTLEPVSGRILLSRPAPAGTVLQVRFYTPVPAAAAPTAAAARPLPTPLESRLRASLRGQIPGLAPAAAPANPRVASTGEEIREELLSGLRLTQHQERLAGSGSDSGTVSYLRADPLDPQTAGAGREEFSSNLDLRPNATSRVRLLNSIARESLFTEDYAEQERQRLQFDQTFGKSTASLLWERRRSDGRGVANALDALSLTLAHPFNKSTLAEGYFSTEESIARGRETTSLVSVTERLSQALQARAGLQLRTSELSGNTVEAGLNVNTQPVRGTDLNFTFRDAGSDRYGRYSRVGADLTSVLSSKLQIQGEISRRGSDQVGSIDTLGLGFAARPTTRALLEAAFSQSAGAALGRESTETVRLSLDPSAALRLQLGYDVSQSSRDGRSQNALWILTMGKERYLKVEGYAAVHDPRDAAPFSDSLYRLELRPVQPLSLSAQLRRVLLDQEDRAIAGVGAEVRLARLFEVAAAYRRPALNGVLAPQMDGQDVRLSFLPVPSFRVFGQYTARPEDSRGALLDQVQQSLGLESTLGSLTLQGTLTRMDGRLVSEPGRRMDFLATLALGGTTRLYGGLRTQDFASVDQQAARVYRLGISQTAGTAFLMLEGQFGWLTDAAGNRTFSQDDALAQARLGFRF